MDDGVKYFPGHKQFEYMQKSLEGLSTDSLNGLGQEGWELVTVLDASIRLYIFKRELAPPPITIQIPETIPMGSQQEKALRELLQEHNVKTRMEEAYQEEALQRSSLSRHTGKLPDGENSDV